MKLLIAEDDRALALLLSTRLREKGWVVDLAHDAMQALMFAMRSVPDAIMLDIAMPGGTGIDALKRLKRSAKTSHIPVVVLSGSIEVKDEPNVLASGAAAFMRKPPDIDALNDILLKLVGAPVVA
jgi:DNA-binding response OmpR family regulator